MTSFAYSINRSAMGLSIPTAVIFNVDGITAQELVQMFHNNP